MSIMKNRQAQSGARGIMVTALGYAMNARPGPASNTGQDQIYLRLADQDSWTLMSGEKSFQQYGDSSNACSTMHLPKQKPPSSLKQTL